MRSLRWILMFVLLLHKYANTTSIAEEINFEVSNLRESVKNDPQQVFEMQEPADSELEDAVKDEQAEDVEGSQSEIVETHVLPEDPEAEEMNAQVKRPRRRRRRRRRKRPKPTASPEELEAYYTVPEEEIKRKPIKYRPHEEAEEPTPEGPTTPRRRNVKRRRRPLKRPPVVEDYPATAEGFADNANATDESQPREQQRPIEEHPEEMPKLTKPHVIEVIETEPPPLKPQLPIVSKKIQVKKENEPLYQIFKDGPKVLHPKESDFTKPPVRDDPYRKPQELIVEDVTNENEYAKLESANSKPKNKEVPEIRKETEPPKEDQGVNARRRKRPPPFKNESTEPPKSELEPKVAESIDTKNQVHAIRKNEVKIDEEVKINLVEQRKLKIDERVKQNNDTNKKDIFKLRRLPPISAILRHAKNRPKNETTTAKAPSKNESSKIKESRTNEILTHAATLDQIDQRMVNETEEEPEQPVVAAPMTSTARVDKTEKLTSTGRPAHKSISFEFPIIAYTEQKQKQTTTAAPITAPASTASTTESTAFIYIPCNNTITEVFRNTFNFSNRENVSKHADPIRTTELVTEPQTTVTSTTTEYHDNKNIFDTTAFKQLEKLLQAEVETVNATIETVNQTKSNKNTTQVSTLIQQLDTNALESELNYLFQNGVTSTPTYRDVKSSTEQNFREPKWFVDSSKHRHQNLNDEKTFTPEKPNNFNYDKEIIISYTSTVSPTSFNDVDPQEVFHGNELSLQLRNNSYRRVSPDGVLHKNKNFNERKKLPLAVKSAIIISGAILALAVLGFFALLLSCKIRQAKSRMKCHRELYRERFQNSEFRQSSRSTSPVVSKSNYNTRNFPNNIQSNVASNRNYYLWQTLRKTFQYD